MLQSVISSLGIDMDRSPKCHCKIAGEDREYEKEGPLPVLKGSEIHEHTGVTITDSPGCP
jgi:hypothetical protein